VTVPILLIVLFFVFPANAHADGNLYDLVVGGAIKNLAKIYVATSNLPRLKAKYTNKLEHMREDKFEKNYRKFYVVYEHLPPSVKKDFDFKPNTSRAELIQAINRVTRHDLIVTINKIPSQMITRQAKSYAKPKQITGQPRVDEKFLWHRIVEKI
jgi:hypothetical protein